VNDILRMAETSTKGIMGPNYEANCVLENLDRAMKLCVFVCHEGDAGVAGAARLSIRLALFLDWLTPTVYFSNPTPLFLYLLIT